MPPSRTTLGARLARGVVEHRAWLAIAWLLAAALLLPLARGASARLQVAARVEGSESDATSRLLADRFDSPFARSAVLVVRGVPAPDREEGRAALRRLVDATTAVRGVTRTLSYLDVPDPAFIGSGGGTFLIAGLDARAGSGDSIVARLRSGTAAAANALRTAHPGAEVAWTGEDALNHDLRLASSSDISAAERRAFPLTLVLLLLAFGAVVSTAIPLGVGALSIGIALGGAALVARVWPLAILLQSVVSMLGLGLGVDYTLLLVSRFREARAAGRDSEAAAVEAATHAGHSVLVSAAAVAVGFAALLVVPLGDLRSIAAGGLLVVTSSALLAVTLVPGILAWLGPRIDFGRVLPTRRRAGESQRWRRWALVVARYPVRTLALAGLPLVLLAGQASRLAPQLPRGDWLPRSAEAARGARALRAMGSGGVVQTLRVVVALPTGVTALDDRGWAATSRLAAALVRDRRVHRVRSLPGIAIGVAPASSLFTVLVPEPVRRTFVSRDGRLALLEVVPSDSIDGAALPALARDLRALDAGAVTGEVGTRLLVGGVPALNADYADAIGRSATLVVALVVGGTFLALLVGFRSVLVPLKAVALNLLTVGAALGVVVLVFQDGHGVRMLGLTGPLDGTFAAVPLLVFCVVFGLSMDYEVFLISRVAESRRRGCSEGAALVNGVGRSGRVITSAASIMVAVFGAFALGGFVLVKILGVALAAAVVLDATLVRLAVGPALLALAGRWNWWPGSRAVADRRDAMQCEVDESRTVPTARERI
ncbi:MAG: MMPL family transporter, partial [Gemmatimonadaceae bacterium]